MAWVKTARFVKNPWALTTSHVSDHRKHWSNEEKEQKQLKFFFYDFECPQYQGSCFQLVCGASEMEKMVSDQLCEDLLNKEGRGYLCQRVFEESTTLNDMGIGWWVGQKRWNWRRNVRHSCSQAQRPSNTESEEGKDISPMIHDDILLISHNYHGYDGHMLLQY